MILTDEQKAAFNDRVKNINPADEQEVLAEYGQAEQKARNRGAGHELPAFACLREGDRGMRHGLLIVRPKRRQSISMLV